MQIMQWAIILCVYVYKLYMCVRVHFWGSHFYRPPVAKKGPKMDCMCVCLVRSKNSSHFAAEASESVSL